MTNTTLKSEAMELLDIDKGSWRDTAEKTSLGYAWLSKLSQGKIQDPGASKLEVLVSYLRDKHSIKTS